MSPKYGHSKLFYLFLPVLYVYVSDFKRLEPIPLFQRASPVTLPRCGILVVVPAPNIVGIETQAVSLYVRPDVSAPKAGPIGILSIQHVSLTTSVMTTTMKTAMKKTLTALDASKAIVTGTESAQKGASQACTLSIFRNLYI